VHRSACHEQVDFLAGHLPARAHLLIATRADPGLRLGRLRASGRLGEIRADDLAFTNDETRSLLELQQVRLSLASIAQLTRRTEGWPVGVYLATLSLLGRADPDQLVRQLSGDNRFIGDYLTEEVLDRHTGRMREFISSVSILDRFSASLCDVVTATTSSAAVLRELERANMFLVPLDEQRHWYRFHHLFAAVARRTLEQEHPDRLPALHSRAAQWFRDNGHVDEAIKHMMAAGDKGGASLLVQANWLQYVSAGRGATVLGWLAALGPPSVASDPAAGVTAAWMAAMSGDVGSLAGHLEALDAFRDHGPLPDGIRSVESAIAMIQGLFGFGGPVAMMAGARRAVEIETDAGSPYYAVAALTLGHSGYVVGDLDLADRFLAAATDSEAALPIIRVLSLSAHSLVEAERGHPDRARDLAFRAMELVDEGGLHTVAQASLAFTALGLAQAASGRPSEAAAAIEHGLAVRRRNPSLSPWATMHHLLAAARVAVEAGDLPMARVLVEENETLMDRFPDGMGAMRARLAAVREAMGQRAARTSEAERLTGREVDVLRLLGDSLTLNDIARELHLSTNTVKTHAKALYRKLGATSRTEAVVIARDRLII
jgi:LuxR family maltose regulon positive regulatory protein